MDKEIVLHIYNGILLNHKERWISISWTKVDVPQLRYVQTCLPLWDSMDCSILGFSVHHQLLELAQTHVHWVSGAIQQSHLLSSPSPPAFNLFSIRVFFNDSALWIRWPKYWSFSFSISSSNVYSGLISFRIDWFDLPAVQETLKSLFQHHSSKASILQCSAFFIVQLSYPYIDNWKNHNLDWMDLCWQSNVSAF